MLVFEDMHCQPWLLIIIMSGSMVQLQLGSVLISRVWVATKSHTDDQGLGYHLCPCKCPRTVSDAGAIQI